MKKVLPQASRMDIASLRTELERWKEQVRLWEMRMGTLQDELRVLGKAIEGARARAGRVQEAEGIEHSREPGDAGASDSGLRNP
jgi:hypothetical protein